jgi:hypothetical protein
MSDAPSKSNAEIDQPRRGIGRFLWLNALMTTAGTVGVALTFGNVYLLYPVAFGLLAAGTAVIFREMFQLLGQDSQYQVDEVAQTDELTVSAPVTSSARVGATPHAA